MGPFGNRGLIQPEDRATIEGMKIKSIALAAILAAGPALTPHAAVADHHLADDISCGQALRFANEGPEDQKRYIGGLILGFAHSAVEAATDENGTTSLTIDEAIQRISVLCIAVSEYGADNLTIQQAGRSVVALEWAERFERLTE